MAKLTAGREDYYLERLAHDREEYLSGHGESPGRWYGQGAASLGLGVEWTEADRHGNREIRGMPKELVRAFSKRTEQVTAEVERLERSGRVRTPRLVKWAVHATRKAKEHEAPETLYARWRQEAAERGTDPDALVRAVTGQARERDQAPSEAVAARVFDRLASPEGLTAQASTFAREDVITALGAGLTGATRQELEALASRFLSERAVSVVADRALEERRWTTPELLGVERRLVAAAANRAGERAGLVAPEAVREALAAYPSLGRTRRGWSATPAWTVPASAWWSAAPGPARRSPWGWRGTPGSSAATACSPPRPPGSPP